MSKSSAAPRVFAVVAIVVLIVALGVAGRLSRTDDGDSGESVVAVYEAARASGRPVYVLFRSLTCQPCIEIAAVTDRVLPDYAGRVEFVEAITDTAGGRELAARFEFQYIPTSFFLAPDGWVAGSHTGTLDDAELRARLDALLEGAE